MIRRILVISWPFLGNRTLLLFPFGQRCFRSDYQKRTNRWNNIIKRKCSIWSRLKRRLVNTRCIKGFLLFNCLWKDIELYSILGDNRKTENTQNSAALISANFQKHHVINYYIWSERNKTTIDRTQGYRHKGRELLFPVSKSTFSRTRVWKTNKEWYTFPTERCTLNIVSVTCQPCF